MRLASCEPTVRSRILQRYNWILNRPLIRNRSFFIYNPYDDIPIKTQLSTAAESEVSKAKKFLQFTASAAGTHQSKLLKTPTLNLQWLSHVSEFVDMHPLAEPQGDILGARYENENEKKEIFPLTGQYAENEIVKRSDESIPTPILAIVENLRALNNEMPREKIIQEQIIKRGPYIWTILMFGLLVRNLKDCIKAVLQLTKDHCRSCNFFTLLEKRQSIPEGWKERNKGKKIPPAVCPRSETPCPLGIGLQPSSRANNYFIHAKTHETEKVLKSSTLPELSCLRTQFVETELLRLTGAFSNQIILWYLGESHLEIHAHRYLNRLSVVEKNLAMLENPAHDFLLLPTREIARNLISDLKDLFYALKNDEPVSRAKSVKRVLSRMNYSHPLNLVYKDLETLVERIESAKDQRIRNPEQLSNVTAEDIQKDIQTILRAPQTWVHDKGMEPKEKRPAYMWLRAEIFTMISVMTMQEGAPPKRRNVIKEVKRLHPEVKEEKIRDNLQKLQDIGRSIKIEKDGTCVPLLKILDNWQHDSTN